MTYDQFGFMLSDKPFDEIVKTVLPEYIKELQGTYEDEDDDWHRLHHLFVSKLEIGKNITEYDFMERYVFLPDCSLYVEMKYNTFDINNFKGWKAEDTPLKVGDKVMFF